MTYWAGGSDPSDPWDWWRQPEDVPDLITNPGPAWWPYPEVVTSHDERPYESLDCGCHLRRPDFEAVLCSAHLAELNADVERLHAARANVGGYIGPSTRREISYATEQGKKILYLVDPASGGSRRVCTCMFNRSQQGHARGCDLYSEPGGSDDG